MVKKSLNYVACCPKCGTAIYEPDWICPVCDEKVYSQYYGKYIDLDQAIYSKTHRDYFYKKDLIYSNYYDDLIRKDIAVEVYNMETDEMDYVPENKSVYSTYYEKHLIFAQTVYSFYYDTYLYADPERTAYSKYIDSYIDIGDDNIIETDDDYIPKKCFAELVNLLVKSWAWPSGNVPILYLTKRLWSRAYTNTGQVF